MQIQQKIKMSGEAQRYTVRAFNERFAIMTKPFNARKTYLYTITDLERSVRGPCNFIFGPPSDLTTTVGALEALKMLETGEMEVSYRHFLPITDEERSQLEQKAA